MNLFELALVASPIAGAVSGALVLRNSTTMRIVEAGLAGLLVGIALYFAFATIIRLGALRAGKQTALKSSVSVFGVFLFIGSPVLAWWLAKVAVGQFFHV
jgi:hypothetical protein